jgi:hypothetical protein
LTTSDEQVRVRAERARQVALFRYRLIQDVIDVRLSSRQRGALVAAIAGREHDGPFGQKITVSMCGPPPRPMPAAGRQQDAASGHGSAAPAVP